MGAGLASCAGAGCVSAVAGDAGEACATTGAATGSAGAGAGTAMGSGGGSDVWTGPAPTGARSPKNTVAAATAASARPPPAHGSHERPPGAAACGIGRLAVMTVLGSDAAM